MWMLLNVFYSARYREHFKNSYFYWAYSELRLSEYSKDDNNLKSFINRLHIDYLYSLFTLFLSVTFYCFFIVSIEMKLSS